MNQNKGIKKEVITGLFQKVLALRKSNIFLFIVLFLFPVLSFSQKTNEAVKQGNDAYRKNDFLNAIKDYTKALVEDSKNATAKFNLANAQQRSDNTEAAAENYDDVIRDTKDADLQSKAYYNKGLSLLQQKKLDAAIDAFKQSLRLSPTDNDARENLQKAMAERKPPPPPKQQPQPDKKKQQKQEQKPKMDKKMMDQKFKMLEDQEKQLQSNLQKQKTNSRDQEKDW